MFEFLTRCNRKSIAIIRTLFRIMIPTIIIVKIMQETGVIHGIAFILEPFMALLDLPGAMALVWCLAIFVNLYAGIIAMIGLLPEYPMSIAQTTILSTLMLTAHTLPIEARITQAAGFRLIPMLILRFGTAILMALLLKEIYAAGNFLTEPAKIIWQNDIQNDSIRQWLIETSLSLFFIMLLIFTFVIILDLLEYLKIIELFGALLKPLLYPLNLSSASLPITLVALTLGISYGGGLIIQHVKQGKIPPRECFTALGLMGICHSVIEDNLLMIITFNAHYSGIYIVRIIGSLIIIYALAKLVKHMPEHIWLKYFWNSPEKRL